MITESIEDILKSAIFSLSGLKTRNGEIKTGTKVADNAAKQQHTSFMNGGGFELNDIIHFHSSEEEMKKYFTSEQIGDTESISLLCAIERKGKIITLRVYPRWFNNDVHSCDKQGVENTDWLSHEGAPADESRDAITTYAMFANFVGKTIKVVDVHTEMCRGLKRGATRDPETKRYPDSAWQGVNRKFYKFEYVTETTNSNNDNN